MRENETESGFDRFKSNNSSSKKKQGLELAMSDLASLCVEGLGFRV